VTPATTPNVHNDLSLISVIPKWSGSDATVTLEEFLESIETSGQIGRWTENDQPEVAVLKLTGSAKLFYSCCNEIHEQGATWHMFKQMFRRGYKNVHTDQYHFRKLQTARQARNESPQQFAENADRIFWASFVSGHIGVPNSQVSFRTRDLLRKP